MTPTSMVMLKPRRKGPPKATSAAHTKVTVPLVKMVRLIVSLMLSLTICLRSPPRTRAMFSRMRS